MAPAIIPIDTLPTYISPEQHRELIASTPASFNDIPTVLRHKEENVSITIDPALPEFSAEDCANGALYVIERYVPIEMTCTALDNETVHSSSCLPPGEGSR